VTETARRKSPVPCFFTGRTGPVFSQVGLTHVFSQVGLTRVFSQVGLTRVFSQVGLEVAAVGEGLVAVRAFERPFLGVGSHVIAARKQTTDTQLFRGGCVTSDDGCYRRELNARGI